MRVGIVCPYSFAVPGGVQNQVLGLAAALMAAGHEAFVLGPGTVPEGIDLHGLDPGRITSAGRTLAIPFNGSVARVGIGPGTAGRVRRWVAAVRPDVLHVHEPVTPSVALAALRVSPVPVVATFHAAVDNSNLLRAAGRVFAADLGRVAEVTAVSQTAASVVVRHLGLLPTIVPNAVFAADFAPVDVTGHAGDGQSPAAWRGGAGPRITFLGRLGEPRKGLQVLLAALPAVRRAMPQAEVVVAGAGEATLPGDVRAVGSITDSARNDLLRATDVFVAPNLGRESFGLILVEALAAGAGVVASDIPAFRDVLTRRDKLHGELFRPGDSTALAASLGRIVTLGPGRDRRPGYSLARSYDWARVAARHVTLYERATAHRGGSVGPARDIT